MNAYKMTDSEWFKQFDETSESFKWFIKEHYPLAWDELLRLRELELHSAMISLMSEMWYYLPDDKFNIKVNPKGWNEFLALIED